MTSRQGDDPASARARDLGSDACRCRCGRRLDAPSLEERARLVQLGLSPDAAEQRSGAGLRSSHWNAGRSLRFGRHFHLASGAGFGACVGGLPTLQSAEHRPAPEPPVGARLFILGRRFRPWACRAPAGARHIPPVPAASDGAQHGQEQHDRPASQGGQQQRHAIEPREQAGAHSHRRGSSRQGCTADNWTKPSARPRARRRPAYCPESGSRRL